MRGPVSRNNEALVRPIFNGAKVVETISAEVCTVLIQCVLFMFGEGRIVQAHFNNK